MFGVCLLFPTMCFTFQTMIQSSSHQVSLVAGAATGFYLTNGIGNYACIDALGVYSPNSQWAEWLTLAPLLNYIAIAVEDKPKDLTLEDIMVIFLIFLCILFGFIMNFYKDFVTGWILWSISSLCMIGNVFMAFKGYFKDFRKITTDSAVVPLPLW